MFLTQTYHLNTAGRVKLELGNNERPKGTPTTIISKSFGENNLTFFLFISRTTKYLFQIIEIQLLIIADWSVPLEILMV